MMPDSGALAAAGVIGYGGPFAAQIRTLRGGASRAQQDVAASWRSARLAELSARGQTLEELT